MGDLLTQTRDPEADAARYASVTKMRSHALVFLEDSLARKLAVAWGACEGDDEEWLAAAGISTPDHAAAEKIAHALRVNGVCRDGGVTDEMALNFIAGMLTRVLPKGKGGKKSVR